MLAQNFKTAAELNLTEAQHDALRKTLVLMETGRVKRAPDDWVYGDDREYSFSGLFDMSQWRTHADCGTIACIGGTACLVAGDAELFNLKYPRLYDLFYPSDVDDAKWHEITVEQAARALRSYLTCGNARWKEATKGEDA